MLNCKFIQFSVQFVLCNSFYHVNIFKEARSMMMTTHSWMMKQGYGVATFIVRLANTPFQANFWIESRSEQIESQQPHAESESQS